MTHSYAYINKSTALGKTRELLTTSGGAPKPEPELRRPRGINCIHVDRGGTRCKSTSQLGELRGLLLGAAHLDRGNVADVLGLDVAVLVALLRVHLLLQGFKISSNCSHEVAVTALFISDAQCVPGRTSFDKTYLENLVLRRWPRSLALPIILATCGLGPAFSRATTQSKRQGTERSLMKTWMACSGT